MLNISFTSLWCIVRTFRLQSTSSFNENTLEKHLVYVTITQFSRGGHKARFGNRPQKLYERPISVSPHASKVAYLH